MKKEKLFYLYVVLGFILNIFIFPIGGLNFLKSALTALTDLDNNVEVKKVVIESDGYADKSPGSWHMEKSAEWTSTTNAKIVFDVDTNPSFHEVPSLDVIMVLDVSGSMSGTKMDKLKESAKKYVNDVLSLDEGNTIALVKYASEASIVTPFVNDADNLITDIDGLEASGNTNYYAGLKKVEELLTDYKASKDRGLVVLFMTDGAANEDTSMIKSQHEYLKDKYPDMMIVGIQYEMGSKITEYLKQASDIQYDAYMGDIYDNFFTATFSGLLEYYNKFEIVDYIDNTYFEVLSEDDITVSIGSVKLETNESGQKVIWTIEPNTLITSADLHMEINVKLKKDYQEKFGYYPTNNRVEVTIKLPDEEEKYTESDKTPILRYGYVVYYDGNYPSECDMTYKTEEYHYFHEIVKLQDNPQKCPGYQFNGWKIIDNVDKITDTSFNMEEQDVHIKGTWSKVGVSKAMNGTVNRSISLYKFIQSQAVPDNIASAYVTGKNGIDFTNASSVTNGQGVYMMADTASDKYPIYYYRGDVDNNNVLFADFCWKIIRTTDTGGVKLIYNGKPTDQGGGKICDNTGKNSNAATKPFSSSAHSPAYVGYKYGTVYQEQSKSIASTSVGFLSSSSFSSKYYYSSTISYENGTYTLGNDATQYTWKESWSNLIGYYTCNSTTKTSCTAPYYVAGGTSSTGYYLKLSDGKLLDEINTNIVLGQGIQDNGNNTYTLQNTVTLKKSEWYNNYSKYKNYYICKNDLTTDTCGINDMFYIISVSNTGVSIVNAEDTKYGKSFAYDEETKQYTLRNTMTVKGNNINNTDLSNYHYTCFNSTGVCNTINYIYYSYNLSTLFYIMISDGKSVENALEEMFSNKNDSVVKDYLENDWYVNNMEKYKSYLEDTQWCNNRSINDLGGWDSNKGLVSKHLIFVSSELCSFGTPKTPSLSCPEEDTLTVANHGVNKPIGLITADEVAFAGAATKINIFNKNYYLYSSESYMTMSPYYYNSNGFSPAVLYFVIGNSVGTGSTTSSSGVRPVVSLRASIKYSDGDGTKENPYVVVTE